MFRRSKKRVVQGGVFIVDGNEFTRNIFKYVLKDTKRHHIVHSSYYDDGLYPMSYHYFFLSIDIDNPIIVGHLAADIRTKIHNAVIIAMSTRNIPSNLVSDIFNGCLQKPFDAQQILDILLLK